MCQCGKCRPMDLRGTFVRQWRYWRKRVNSLSASYRVTDVLYLAKPFDTHALAVSCLLLGTAILSGAAAESAFEYRVDANTIQHTLPLYRNRTAWIRSARRDAVNAMIYPELQYMQIPARVHDNLTIACAWDVAIPPFDSRTTSIQSAIDQWHGWKRKERELLSVSESTPRTERNVSSQPPHHSYCPELYTPSEKPAIYESRWKFNLEMCRVVCYPEATCQFVETLKISRIESSARFVCEPVSILDRSAQQCQVINIDVDTQTSTVPSTAAHSVGRGNNGLILLLSAAATLHAIQNYNI